MVSSMKIATLPYTTWHYTKTETRHWRTEAEAH